MASKRSFEEGEGSASKRNHTDESNEGSSMRRSPRESYNLESIMRRVMREELFNERCNQLSVQSSPSTHAYVTKGSSIQEPPNIEILRSVLREELDYCSQLTRQSSPGHLTRGSSMPDLSILELRKMVREELERHYSKHSFRYPQQQMATSGSKRCLLHFANSLEDTIYTDSEASLQVVILDSSSRKMVTTGYLSSIQVEILVVDGDYGQKDWLREFDDSQLSARKGKRPLLTGDLVVQLIEGVGYISEVMFTDNSSWTKGGRFKLGARAVENREEIQDAVSGAFRVMDQRGKASQKHKLPRLFDEIWRLKMIKKGGVFHLLLDSMEIRTVRDFLRWLQIDESSLRAKCVSGSNGMTKNTWDTIVTHAKKYIPDNNEYSYHVAGQQVVLLFDSIYNVTGAIFEGQNYVAADSFTTSNKSLVEILKRHAYQHHSSIIEFDMEDPKLQAYLNHKSIGKSDGVDLKGQAYEHKNSVVEFKTEDLTRQAYQDQNSVVEFDMEDLKRQAYQYSNDIVEPDQPPTSPTILPFEAASTSYVTDTQRCAFLITNEGEAMHQCLHTVNPLPHVSEDNFQLGNIVHSEVNDISTGEFGTHQTFAITDEPFDADSIVFTGEYMLLSQELADPSFREDLIDAGNHGSLFIDGGGHVQGGEASEEQWK